MPAWLGGKGSRAARKLVCAEIEARGLDASAVRLSIMDRLPDLAEAFREVFPGGPRGVLSGAQGAQRPKLASRSSPRQR